MTHCVRTEQVLAGHHTYNLNNDFFHDVRVLQIIQEFGGWRTRQQSQVCCVGRLIGSVSDANCEGLHALVLCISHSREDIRVSGMKEAIGHQQGNLDALWARFFHKYLGHVGDGVGGVSAVADVGHRCDSALEVLRASPLFEGLLDDDVAAVLKQGRSPAEFAAYIQADALEAFYNVHGELLLLLVVVLGRLRAVQQKAQLQTAVLIQDS